VGNTKSVFSAIKSAFVQELPEGDVEPSPAPIAKATPTPAPPTIDPESQKSLLDAIEANKLDSFDYLKFKNSLDELAQDIPDERLRIKTVFATAKAMKITKEKIIQTAQHYITVLDQATTEFNAAVADKIQKDIGDDESKVKSLDETITAKQNQVTKLNDEIEKLTEKRDALNQQVQDGKDFVVKKKAAFEATYNTMVQEIKADINKLTSYLG